MAERTRYTPGWGYAGQISGSFAGKAAAPVHPVADLTRYVAAWGYAGRRCGSFAGKAANASATGGTRRQRQIKSLIRRRPRRC